MYQQNKSFEFKVKFRKANNHCKTVLEAVKLAYATKRKLFAKNLFKNSNLDDSGLSLPVFPSRTFLDCWKVSSVVPVFKDVWGKV